MPCQCLRLTELAQRRHLSSTAGAKPCLVEFQFRRKVVTFFLPKPAFSVPPPVVSGPARRFCFIKVSFAPWAEARRVWRLSNKLLKAFSVPPLFLRPHRRIFCGVIHGDAACRAYPNLGGFDLDIMGRLFNLMQLNISNILRCSFLL